MNQQCSNERRNFWGSGLCAPLTLHELRGAKAEYKIYVLLFFSFAVWGVALHTLGFGWSVGPDEKYLLSLAIYAGIFFTSFVAYIGAAALLWVSASIRNGAVDLILISLSSLLAVIFGRGAMTLSNPELEANHFVILTEAATLELSILLFFWGRVSVPERKVALGKDTASEELAAEMKKPEEKCVCIGSFSIFPETLISVEANGHYLTVETTNFTREIRLALHRVLSLLPNDLGCLVHRSIWISRYAVEGVEKRKGRIFVRLKNGNAVCVARPRQSEVSDWLRDLGFD